MPIPMTPDQLDKHMQSNMPPSMLAQVQPQRRKECCQGMSQAMATVGQNQGQSL